MAEPHPQVIDPHDPVVKKLRDACLRYPEAIEQEAWGRPSFRAGKKIFLLVSAGMDRPRSMVFKPPPDDLPAYQADTRYFLPKYWAGRGWMGIDLGGPEVDWNHVGELIEESYRQVALVRQLRELDAGTLPRLIGSSGWVLARQQQKMRP